MNPKVQTKEVHTVSKVSRIWSAISVPCVRGIGIAGCLFLLSQASAAQTALGTRAASLQPGYWTEVPTNGFTYSLIAPDGDDTVLAYANHAVWDPVNKELLFFGGEHIDPSKSGCGTSMWDDTCADRANRFLRYIDSTNTWTTFPHHGHVAGHTYDHNALDPVTGDFYLRNWPTSFTTGVWKFTRSTQTWSHLPVPSDSIIYETGTAAGAIAWFPEMGGIVEVLGSFGQVVRFNGSQWISLASMGAGSMGAGNNVAEYDPVHHLLVFGGGQAAGSKIYKMNSGGNITALTACPARCASDGVNLFTVDPVSGRALLFVAGSSYDLDIVNNTWAQLPSSANAPFSFGRVAIAPISTYGVVMALSWSGGDPHVWIYKHAPAAPDTQPPSTPSNLTATAVSSSQINLTWTASTDNVGVVGYYLFRDGALIASPTSPSYADRSLTANRNYVYSVASVDAAGNQSTPSASVSAQTLPPGQTPVLTFAQLCSQPGVLKCVGFDSSADIPLGTNYQPYQSLGASYGIEYPVNDKNPSDGSIFSAVPPAIDTTIRSSGTGSLRFTIPSHSPQNCAGDWFTNFPQVTSGDLYIQWKQRFSPEMLQAFSDIYGRSGPGSTTAWKQAIIGGGDIPPCSPQDPTTWELPGHGCAPSHTWNAFVVQNYDQHGFPLMYRGHIYVPLAEVLHGGYSFQNVRPSPYCVGYGPANCFLYFPNEWMTFQIHIKVGTWSKYFDAGNGPPPMHGDGMNHRDSQVELWMARENQPMEYVLSYTHTDILDPVYYGAGSSYPPGTRQFGKLWFLPYMTNKDWTQAHPTAYTWYDDLIISTQPIGILPPTMAPPARLRSR
jgi:hypothetical protein